MHGISVTIAGSPTPAGAFTVHYQSHEATRPQGVGQEKLKSPVFFDLAVEGVAAGTATVRITHDSVTPSHKVNHWDGTKWVEHPEAAVSKKTVQAQFRLSDLHGTPIVIGT
jgi:hypothetical protein